MNTFPTWEDAQAAADDLNAKKGDPKGAWFPKNLRDVFCIAWLRNSTTYLLKPIEELRAENERLRAALGQIIDLDPPAHRFKDSDENRATKIARAALAPIGPLNDSVR
jgi:hypothetical protein